MSLAQAGAAFSGSAKAAAIAVGTLDTPAKEFVRPFPKQVDRKPCSGAHCFGAPRRFASPVGRAVTAIGACREAVATQTGCIIYVEMKMDMRRQVVETKRCFIPGHRGGDAWLACAVLRPQPEAAVGPQHPGEHCLHESFRCLGERCCLLPSCLAAADIEVLPASASSRTQSSRLQSLHVQCIQSACAFPGGAAAPCRDERGGGPHLQSHGAQGRPRPDRGRRVFTPWRPVVALRPGCASADHYFAARTKIAARQHAKVASCSGGRMNSEITRCPETLPGPTWTIRTRWTQSSWRSGGRHKASAALPKLTAI